MGVERDELMAKITFQQQSDFYKKLKKLQEAADSDEFLEKAVVKGAEPVADEIRKNLEALPSEKFRYLRGEDTFHVLSNSEKEDLLESFGLTPILRDKKGFVHTKAGFDGYGSHPTSSYPHGLPNQLLARAVESGSSVRDKRPFVRPAVNATRNDAIEAMEEVVDDEMKRIFE